jgi:UDP-N-acetylglucosamine--N-acetylmuramyl-(pentapeptide) pyrophosphoryl-undecaprenol N-acetylglucosamine transferase
MGVAVQLWYVNRKRIGPLIEALTRSLDPRIELRPIPVQQPLTMMSRLRAIGRLWRDAHRLFKAEQPAAVVGFGGWASVPVVLAAKECGIPTLLHEQNVQFGRANRRLARLVDAVAVSFAETRQRMGVHMTVTGLPVRPEIGMTSRSEGAARLGLDAGKPTLLIVGGSQGAQALNRIMAGIAGLMTPPETSSWQIVHIAGANEADALSQSYADAKVSAAVYPYLADMAAAYAAADLVISRSGASTVAELARCSKPAILVPYPHASGHQRANAELAEQVGGGMVFEDQEASADRVLSAARRILADERLRFMMGQQMHNLDYPNAAVHLAELILGTAQGRGGQSEAQPVAWVGPLQLSEVAHTA